MAEQTKKKGRPPKAKSAEANTTNIKAETKDNNDMNDIIVQMQKQMAEMQKQLDKANKEKEKAVGQNLDLQSLVEALKSNSANATDINLPNYVTVVSLIPNIYNISTERDGKGTCYTFEELGETKIISLNDMQKIVGVSKYRKQAEEGYFYILENEVNDYLRLNQVSNTIDDIKGIIDLSTDDCVERFMSLEDKLKEAIADKMALDMANGKKLDRNKLSDIFDKTEIDVEEKARNLKKVMNK